MAFGSQSWASDITVQVNWPQWASENSVQVYNAANSTAVTSPAFTSGTTGSDPYTGSQVYALADSTTFTLRMTDSYGDGWNGGGVVSII